MIAHSLMAAVNERAGGKGRIASFSHSAHPWLALPQHIRWYEIVKLFTTALAFGFLALLCACDQKAQQPLSTKAAQGATARTYFLYIRIPEQIMPVERGKKYEDPINELLSQHGLGEVSGGGTMLTKDKQIEYVGLDVDVTDPQKAIPLLVAKLKEIGVPKGTVIEQNEPEKKTIPIE